MLDIQSADYATIKLDDGRTYQTHRSRLRKVSPAPIPPKASLWRSSSMTKVEKPSRVDVPALRAALATKLGVPEKSIAHNSHHAGRWSSMHRQFEEIAVSLASTHQVDVLIHGSPEENVDSILEHSLSVEKSRYGSMFWLTSNLYTASEYARGASRIVGFAALRSKEATTGWGHVFTLVHRPRSSPAAFHGLSLDCSSSSLLSGATDAKVGGARDLIRTDSVLCSLQRFAPRSLQKANV